MSTSLSRRHTQSDTGRWVTLTTVALVHIAALFAMVDTAHLVTGRHDGFAYTLTLLSLVASLAVTAFVAYAWQSRSRAGVWHGSFTDALETPTAITGGLVFLAVATSFGLVDSSVVDNVTAVVTFGAVLGAFKIAVAVRRCWSDACSA